jgi:hypothetical protein
MLPLRRQQLLQVQNGIEVTKTDLWHSVARERGGKLEKNQHDVWARQTPGGPRELRRLKQ